MSGKSGDLTSHKYEKLCVLAGRVHCHVTDTFTRQRHGLTERITADRVLILLGNKWCIHTSKYNLTVRFIGDQVDRMSVFLLFCTQDIRQLCDRGS